jgi:O-antigen/teichoic acid export membrane protein
LSLKRNIIANYISQIYVTAVSILVLPLYMKYMGAEAYGLVGFFSMLQAWFTLLDLGLTPTIGRETARYHAKAVSQLAYRQLYRALSTIFYTIAIVGGCILLLLSDVFSNRWLNVTELPLSEVVSAVQVMAISVALRWIGGLYRGVITGSERLVWLSGFNILISTLRFVAVFFTMWKYGFTPIIFFIHQLVVALLELLGLYVMSRRLLPKLNQPIGWSFHPVRPVLRFAMTIAFTSAVWVLVTQTDKLVLSGILPLAQYGYFTLAVLVANSVMIVSGPVSTALMPRMAKLYAENKYEELVNVYCNATQLVSIVAGTAAVTLAACSEPLLFAWTGDKSFASQAGPILSLYAIGNGFLALSAFPGYLQQAYGNLKYHLIGNMLIFVFLVPCSAAVSVYFGAIGAAWVWLLLNMLYFIFWVAYSHHKLNPGLHGRWFVTGFARFTFPVVVLCLVFRLLPIDFDDRWYSLLYVLSFSCLVFVVGVASSSFFLEKFRGYYKCYFQ